MAGPDPEWIRKVRAKDRETWGAIFIEHLPGITHLCTSMGARNRDLPHDCLAEAYASASKFRPPYHLSGWLNMIARHLVLHERREKTNLPNGGEIVASSPDGRASFAGEIELKEAVRLSLAKLPADQRQLLLWILDDELQLKEIARRLGVAEKTARKKVSEAKDNFERILRDHGC